ncbi:MAG: hypothetical protein LC791_12060 [Acidobacteria bacterium]|nr:hypothetical protein [Acidobacteriota bacterium]
MRAWNVLATGYPAASRVFLLSPAYCGGRRAQALLSPRARGEMAGRLASGALTLADAFAFMSGLYFRGKLAYAHAFTASESASWARVITPTRGLQPLDLIVSPALIEEFASVDVASGGERFQGPLERDAWEVASRLGPCDRVVLLGSIATDKYVAILSRVFAHRLVCPSAFVGRGDMSRGALLLRSAAARTELEYMPLSSAVVRRGRRAPSINADAAGC